MAIEFNKSSQKGKRSGAQADHGFSGGDAVRLSVSSVSDIPSAKTFINTTNHGLKVKMPDSVHIFLPGETIEFLPKELGEDGADRELARRARRAEMKSKASMDWAKRNKGDRRD